VGPINPSPFEQTRAYADRTALQWLLLKRENPQTAAMQLILNAAEQFPLDPHRVHVWDRLDLALTGSYHDSFLDCIRGYSLELFGQDPELLDWNGKCSLFRILTIMCCGQLVDLTSVWRTCRPHLQAANSDELYNAMLEEVVNITTLFEEHCMARSEPCLLGFLRDVFWICSFNPATGTKMANKILSSLLFDFPSRRLRDYLVGVFLRDILRIGPSKQSTYSFTIFRYCDKHTLDLIEHAGTDPTALQFARIVFDFSFDRREFRDLQQCIQGVDRQVLDWILYLYADDEKLGPECVELLVREGANVNFVLSNYHDEKGNAFKQPMNIPLTPLSKVVRSGGWGALPRVRLLLEYGADVLLDTRGGYLSVVTRKFRDNWISSNGERCKRYTELVELLEELERAEIAKRGFQLPEAPPTGTAHFPSSIHHADGI